MRKFCIITAKDIVGYSDDSNVILSDDLLYFEMFPCWATIDSLDEIDELTDIVESKPEGAEFQIIIDYFEYLAGKDMVTESADDKEVLLQVIESNFEEFLKDGTIKLVDSDDVIIEVEGPPVVSDVHEIIELDTE